MVIAATHRGRRVAVKVFKTALLASGALEHAVALLQAEVDKMAAASEGGFNEFVVVPLGLLVGAAPPPIIAALGPHAPACIATGSSSHLCAMVMKWQDGGTLHELLHEPTRAWGAGTAERLLMCARLASGVAALHAAGVIHGDVKGENVMLSDRSATPCPRFTDFGFAELRSAASSASAASSRGVGEQRGTWPYMAPEMLLEKEDRSPPEGVSRSGDVYALATLCWEVLSGGVPWDGCTEQRRVRMLVQGKAGGPATLLGTPPLPVDTPAAVRAALGRCLSEERGARLPADRVAELLHQAEQEMAGGSWHIFLSHAWGADGKPAPLTFEVYQRLVDAGFRVWLDKAEMGHDMDVSMQNGIAKSGCVVALLSSRYGTKPDPAKDNCLKELRWASATGRPIIACLADPDAGWFPAADGEVARLVGTHHLFPDLRAAAAVDWRADVSAGEREVLTKVPGALPKLLQFVGQKLALTRIAEPEGADRSAVLSLVAALTSHSSDSAVVEQSCSTLWSITQSSAGEKAAVAAGAVPAVVAVLKKYSCVDAVAEKACRLLRSITFCPAGEVAAVAVRAAPAIVAVLKNFPRVRDVAEQACGALRSISYLAAGQEAAVSADAVPSIVAALVYPLVVADVAEQACGALGNIALSSAGKDAAVAAKAVPAIVAALKTFPRIDAVAEQACGALRIIAAIPAGQEAAVAAGATPAIVAVLTAHPSVADVAEQACGALRFIAAIPAGQKAAVAADAVPAVLAALKAHPSVADVAKQACGALRSITYLPAGKEAAVAADALPAILAALKCHLGVADVAGQACGALCNIAASPHAIEAVLAAGAVPAVVATLKAHPSVAAVVEQACRTLKKLTRTEAGKEAAVAAEAVPALVAALNTHLSVPSVTDMACRALSNLLHSKGAVEAGALSAIVAALSAHPSNVNIAKQACSALWILSHDSADYREAIEAAGALPAIIAALKAHPREAAVAENACLFFFSSGCPAFQEEVAVAEDAVQAIAAALKANPSAFLGQGSMTGCIAAGAAYVLVAALDALTGEAQAEAHALARATLALLNYTDSATEKE